MEINTNVETKAKKTKKGPGVSDSKTDGQGIDVINTSDYKLSKSGKKYRAHRIIFNKGEDDGKKGVVEQMKKSFNAFVEQHSVDLTEEELNQLEQELNEVLSKNAGAGEWIKDFVHSDNPKFKGKTKEKRKQMALAAYYAAQRNEEVEIEEEVTDKVIKRGAELDKKTKEIQANLDRRIQGRNNDDAVKRIQASFDKRMKLRKEEAEQLEEDFVEIMETYDADDYEATSEKSQFGGHRAVLKHKKTGRESYVGGTSYKSAEHAKGEAEVYRKNYNATGKTSPGANYRHDRAVAEYRKNAKAQGHLHESVWDWKNKAKDASGHKTGDTTATKHDVKKTSTGTVYTKQRDADGMSKEFKRDTGPAMKRGRGRPKKSSFGEAVEFLMGLDEETFDSMMEEGFDAFMERYEQLDELSRDTLLSYANKVSLDSQKHSKDPTKRSGEKASRSVTGYARAHNRLDKPVK